MARSRPSRAPSHPRARAQRFEVLIGILGFFTLMALIQAVVTEVQGRSAVVPALVLLAFVIALALAIRGRRNTGV